MNVARYHGSVVTSNAVKCGSIIANVGLFFVAEVIFLYKLFIFKRRNSNHGNN